MNQVEIRLFEAGSQHHPAEESFQSLVGCPFSATALYNGTREFGAQLLALDYLHAQITCWTGFLNAFLKRIDKPLAKDILWGNLPPEQSPKWAYANHVIGIHNIVKALTCAIEMTRRSIRLNVSRLDDNQKDRIEQAFLRSEGQCLIANTLMERIQQRFDTTTEIFEEQIRKRQEAAVKLLTWIACIFLPLSTASSLLSMGSRAKDIGGAVWWDWLSIVVITGLIVLLGYAWAMKSFALRRSEHFFSAHRKFTNAKRATLENHERKTLIHTGVRFLVILSICALTLGAVAAFLIGMFMSLETGAEVLGYSVAGAVGLTVAPLLIWRLVNLCLWIAQSIWGRSWVWPYHSPDEILPSPEGKKFVNSLCILFGVVLGSTLMLFPILFTSLFTGSMTFELLYRFIQVRKTTGFNGDPKKSKEKVATVEGIDKEDGDIDVEQEAAV